MQDLFLTQQTPVEFSRKDEENYPSAPERCPFADCKTRQKMGKHGYYSRNVISEGYVGQIYVRRYICPKCRRTVSYLPSFMLPYYQYAARTIGKLLFHGMHNVPKEKSGSSEPLLRNLRYYRKRLYENKSRIWYALSQTVKWKTKEPAADSVKGFSSQFTAYLKAEQDFEEFSYEFFQTMKRGLLSPVYKAQAI